MKNTFETIIDESLSHLSDPVKKQFDNTYLLSIVNDWEDGKWRYSKFQKFIWDNIAETALSANERDSYIDNPYSTLAESAKKLRLLDVTSTGESSEIAEIVLYGIMKQYYNALPAVPKIFYKQNINDNAKGADSVHVVVDGNNFSLWLGEAKFYNSIEDARLYEIISSVETHLTTEKLKKENSIISGVSDLQTLISNPNLFERIKAALGSGEPIDKIKPILHVPILLLHECSITESTTDLTDQYKNEIEKHHRERAATYFSKQYKKLEKSVHKYSSVTFHLILLPIPKKEPIIKSFTSTAHSLRS